MDKVSVYNLQLVSGQASTEYLWKQYQCWPKTYRLSCFILTSTHFTVNKHYFLEEDCAP